MPAVTVQDLHTLDRLDRPGGTVRPVRRVTTAPAGFEGSGFPVRRGFVGVPLERLDPFVHMDQMGEIDYAPGAAVGTPWHPHRGFETVTYMIDGTFRHRDNHGGGGLITDGDTLRLGADTDLDTRTGDFEVLLLGGEPIGEPVVVSGPFVMNTIEELEQAARDFRSGVFGPIPV